MKEPSSYFPRSTRRHGLGALLWSLFAIWAQEARAQEKEQVVAESVVPVVSVYGIELPPHSNSLGMRFVGTEGAAVRYSEYEVTVGDFAVFLKEAGYPRDAEELYFPQGEDHPVVNVNREDAEAFCDWLTRREREQGTITSGQSYRLPTNDEWSLAVGLDPETERSGKLEGRMAEESAFPWGSVWPPPAGAGNFAAEEIAGYEDSYRFTAPVGSFDGTGSGIHDLGGNVWEWTRDPARSDQNSATLRGGAWIYFRPEFLRSSYRYQVPGDMRAPTFGFRCVFEDSILREKIWLARRKLNRSTVAKASERFRAKDEKLEEDALESARSRFLSSRGREGSDGLEVSHDVAPPVAGKRFVNSLGMDFVPLPGDGVMAGVFEVKVKEFAYFASQQGIDWQKPGFRQTDSHCAVGATFDQAVAFCEWLTARDQKVGTLLPSQRYRLPTDAEWSLAVGFVEEAGQPEGQADVQQDIFPWGTQWPPPSYVANLDGSRIPEFRDRFSYTAPVGGRPKNQLGISDLAGNASEWCSDRFPPGSVSRMVRGSSWLDSSREVLHSAYRKHFPPDTSKSDVGFRCFLQLE